MAGDIAWAAGLFEGYEEVEEGDRVVASGLLGLRRPVSALGATSFT